MNKFTRWFYHQLPPRYTIVIPSADSDRKKSLAQQKAIQKAIDKYDQPMMVLHKKTLFFPIGIGLSIESIDGGPDKGPYDILSHSIFVEDSERDPREDSIPMEEFQEKWKE